MSDLEMGGGAGGLNDIVEDTTPQLGGNLDVNGNSIVSTSGGNIAITPNTSGVVVLDGLSWPTADGTNTQVIQTNGSGVLSFADGGGGVVGGLHPPFDNDGTFVNGTIIVDSSSFGSVSMPDERIYTYPVCVPLDCTLDNLCCEVKTAASGATLRMGIYDDLGGLPNNLVVETGVLSASSAVIVDSAALSTSLTAGWYWVAVTVDLNGGTVSLGGTISYKTPGFLRDNGTNFVVTNYAYKFSVSPASSLPDPLTGLTYSALSSLPHIILRLSI